MSLTKEEFLKKLDQEDPKLDPACGGAAEKFKELLDDYDLVPYGTPLRSFLSTLSSEVKTLGGKEPLTDFGYSLCLGNLGKLKDDLQKKDEETQETVEKALRDLFMKQKVHPPEEYFDALEAVNDFYEIGMDMDVIRYGKEGAAKAKEEAARRKAVEEKQAAEEKRRAEEAAQKEKTWLKYVNLHKPKPGRNYSEKEKKALLSKMMVAANVHVSDQQENRKTPFNLDAARKYAAKLTDQWAFKHLTRDPDDLDRLLARDPDRLAEMTQEIRRPFANVSLADRKAKIKELQGMLKYMDPKEGRSDKYKAMYESIEGITEEQLNGLQDCDDPKKNGEELLQKIFDSTEKYQKGKKSLRSKPDQACRFDQSVDILNTIGNTSQAARNMTDGLIDRINEVREKHGQRTYGITFGSQEEEFKTHSNAWRKYQENLQKFAAGKNQNPDMKKPLDPFAEPPKPRNILPFNENATMLDYEKYKDSYESLPAFTGDSGDFVNSPEGIQTHRFTWKAYRDAEMSKDTAMEVIAGALAAKDTPLLYSKAWGNKVGCDGTVFKANYNKYLNDPAVEKLAGQLEKPQARKKYFPEDKEIEFENLDVNALQEDYQKLMPQAPAL